MDSCFEDIAVEFLGVAFHNILYYTSVYPTNIFESRRKYNLVVYTCIHPDVVQYINLTLKNIRECLKIGQLYKVVFSVTNNSYKPLLNFVFDINKSIIYDETSDAYLIQVEQNLRAFILGISSNSDRYQCLPEDRSFAINVHTNESTAVCLATNPNLEDFPMVETKEQWEEMVNVIPLRNFPVRGYQLETYMELY